MTGTPGGIDDLAARGFGSGAAAYESGRPGYPGAAVEHLVRALGIGAGRRVVDLGAGTGKLARLLAPTGARVVGVEPVFAMRRGFAASVSRASVVGGTAEALPLAGGCADAVLSAQAFHWFDAAVALAEIRRVLRPGGGLGLMWNVRDESVPWVARMSEVIHWHREKISRYGTTDWAAVVAAAGGFAPVERRTFAHRQLVDRERLADRVRSVSYIATLPEAEREDLVQQVLALVEDQPREFPLPYRTDVYWCRRT